MRVTRSRLYSVALREYVASVDADVYPLSVSGENCKNCPYAYDGSCGGVAVNLAPDGEPYSPSIFHTPEVTTPCL